MPLVKPRLIYPFINFLKQMATYDDTTSLRPKIGLAKWLTLKYSTRPGPILLSWSSVGLYDLPPCHNKRHGEHKKGEYAILKINIKQHLWLISRIHCRCNHLLFHSSRGSCSSFTSAGSLNHLQDSSIPSQSDQCLHISNTCHYSYPSSSDWSLDQHWISSGKPVWVTDSKTS